MTLLGLLHRLALLSAVPVLAAPDATAAACPPLDLPVERITPPPAQYVEFCARHPGDCRLTGPPQIRLTKERRRVLNEVNRTVNDTTRFVPDIEWIGREEHWSYPLRGCGDCEDYALEKRRRLVERSFASAALTLAIVHHRTRLFPHAVLLAATSEGTLVLDSLTDAVRCWTKVPYDFESRERPDGRWTRFDQRAWERSPDAAD